jgi:hypothetical protein
MSTSGFDTVVHTISSAVAGAGTFTIAYPTNRSAGDYTGAHAHKLYANGADYSAPVDFTLTFNSGDITVTWDAAEATLAAGTRVHIQLDRLGTDRPPVVLPASMRPVQLVVIDLGSPDADDANGYVESQDLTDAGVFSTDTTAAAALAAAALNGKPDVPRNVVAAWTTTAVLTITGKDVDGNTMVETSASDTTFTGKKAFAEVTDISSSEDITALTVGTGDVLGLPVYVSEGAYVRDEFEDGVSVGLKPSTVYVPWDLPEVELLAADLVSLPCPVAGTIKRMVSMAGIAIGTGGTLTLKVNNTAVDGLSLVVADSAPAGTLDSDTPTAGHASTVVAVDDEIEIVPDAAFATNGSLYGYIEILTSGIGRLQGTLVAGVTSEATGTTGDVRGTYSPATGPDGATAFALMMALPDPGNAGVAQFTG